MGYGMKTKVGVIADNLKALRVRHCMTQETLSRLSNVPVAALQSYETGATAMPADDAWTLADTFGIAMDEFLGRTPPEQERL